MRLGLHTRWIGGLAGLALLTASCATPVPPAPATAADWEPEKPAEKPADKAAASPAARPKSEPGMRIDDSLERLIVSEETRKP